MSLIKRYEAKDMANIMRLLEIFRKKSASILLSAKPAGDLIVRLSSVIIEGKTSKLNLMKSCR